MHAANLRRALAATLCASVMVAARACSLTTSLDDRSSGVDDTTLDGPSANDALLASDRAATEGGDSAAIDAAGSRYAAVVLADAPLLILPPRRDRPHEGYVRLLEVGSSLRCSAAATCSRSSSVISSAFWMVTPCAASAIST